MFLCCMWMDYIMKSRKIYLRKKRPNIFQVAAVHIYKLHHQNDLPRYVTNLNECLQGDLRLHSDTLHYPMVTGHCPEVSLLRCSLPFLHQIKIVCLSKDIELLWPVVSSVTA